MKLYSFSINFYLFTLMQVDFYHISVNFHHSKTKPQNNVDIGKGPCLFHCGIDCFYLKLMTFIVCCVFSTCLFVLRIYHFCVCPVRDSGLFLWRLVHSSFRLTITLIYFTVLLLLISLYFLYD